MSKTNAEVETPSPRCPKHRTLLRESDGYCWFTGHCVPREQWVYGKEQPTFDAEANPQLEMEVRL